MVSQGCVWRFPEGWKFTDFLSNFIQYLVTLTVNIYIYEMKFSVFQFLPGTVCNLEGSLSNFISPSIRYLYTFVSATLSLAWSADLLKVQSDLSFWSLPKTLLLTLQVTPVTALVNDLQLDLLLLTTALWFQKFSTSSVCLST